MMPLRSWLIAALMIILLGCTDDVPTYAPVMDLNRNEPIPKTGTYRVHKGQTLYEIAWRFGQDYRFLASNNQITAPYEIYPGQIIYLRKHKTSLHPPPKTPIVLEKKRPTKQVKPIPQTIEPNYHIGRWYLPAKGKIINGFSAHNKGWNIGGNFQTPIYATAAGKVVYSGSGLRSYGNLIIIKHNSLYLSAYAHNFQNLVKEGEWVKQGEKIATMGRVGNQPLVHFEIRKAGKSINPKNLIIDN